MLAIIFAFISYLGWGIGDILGAQTSRKIGGYSFSLYLSVIGLILSSFYIPFALADLNKFTLESLIIIIILTFLGPIPLVAFYEGLRVGNAAVVGTIASSFALVTVLLSIIFLGEKISLGQSIFISIIFLGIILSSLNLRQLKNKNILLDRGIPYAIVAMLLWGVYFTFIKIPIKQIGWFWPGYLTWLSFPIILIVMQVKRIKLIKPDKRVFIPLLLAALLINIGGISYNLAISEGLVSLVAPIASSSVTLFVFLAFLIFKDPITKQQVVGVVTTLIGIVLLSIFSI
ncbi:DMT family transporter [Candidatus Daviesbacteria bacterium]|nr:DMT family transporter [Candidatus Daviesbacteria bacterium]